MGRRELCPCCLKYVTQGQLKRHAEEATRKQSILAMGGDPTIPDIPLREKPITGNNIFPPQASAPPPTLTPTPAPPVDDDISYPEDPIDSPQDPLPLPCFIAPHPVEDN